MFTLTIIEIDNRQNPKGIWFRSRSIKLDDGDLKKPRHSIHSRRKSVNLYRCPFDT